MTGAIATMSDIYSTGEPAEASIDGGYKSYLHTTGSDSPLSDYSKWLRIEITETQSVVTV